MGDVGAGQLTPFDANSDFTVAAFIVRQIMALLDTMKPAQVVAVHPGSGSPPAPGTVDVQLLVSSLDGSGNKVDQGIVYGLPFQRQQGGPWSVICDPAVNDFGFVVCADRDITNVKKNPGVQIPDSLRQFSVSDGVFVCGAFFQSATSAYVWLKSDGSFQIVDGLGNSIESTAIGMTVTDVNGNVMQMLAGSVNFVTAALKVNGVPVTVP